ncbi:sigma-54 interaction domain-containing protein [Planctomycetota bacterium]
MNLLEKTLVISRKTEMQELAQQVSEQIFMADDLSEAIDMVSSLDPELVVFDGLSSPSNVREFLRGTDVAPHVVVVTPTSDTDQGAYCEAGAMDCLQGKEDLPRLRQIAADLTQNAVTPSPTHTPEHFFLDGLAERVSIVGHSQATQDELRMITLVAHSQCNPVLVVGETGTGKEMAAQAVHEIRSPGQRFVAVNCAALTANLLESELFGHVKGSFTGADREKIGLFELAAEGTIFLDEISEMPMDLQAKLLRVLQEKTFRKVGGTKDIACHATIVASSNRQLKEEVQAGRFRRDLYYRLSVCPIALASLNSPRRRADIALLAEYFLLHSTICPEKQGTITALTKLAAEMLVKHDWPGNVRELRNVIDRAIMLETTNKIGLSSIILDPDNIDIAEQDVVGMEIKDFSLAHAERELIARALKETGWQKTQAASLLGITRATLYAKVKQYQIERENHPLPTAVSAPTRTNPQAVAV